MELYAGSSGEYRFNAVGIKMIGPKIIKSLELTGKTIDELAEQLSLKNPVALAITGKMVILKRITKEEYQGNYFEALFPNTNPNEFYLIARESGEYIWISVIRKTILENIIGKLISQGFRLLHLSLGPFSLENVLPYLAMESGGAISTQFYSIQVNRQREFLEIGKMNASEIEEPQEYNLGDQYFRPASLTAFSVSLYLVRSDFSQLPYADIRIQEQREEYFYYQSFVKTGWSALISVLLMLIVSFLIYNHYFRINEELQVSENIAKSRRLDDVKNEDKLKVESAFLHETGWERSSRVSYYADRIASLVPDNTVLTNMQIFPIREGLFFEKEGSHFKMDTVIVNGNCDDPEDLSVFLNNLKNSNSIQSVMVQDYSYKKEKAKAFFSMQMIVKQ